MSTTEAAAGGEIWNPDFTGDLSSLFANLSTRLHEPNVQERWYPGSFAAWVDTAALPYYRIPDASSMVELLEAALVRPAGIRLDFDDWLESFETQRRAARSRTETRSVATHLRIAFAGGIAGGVLALGCGLVALTVLKDAYRPNPYVAFALAFGGVMLVASVTVAILERRWRATSE